MQHVYFAPEDDSSRSVETSIVTATIRWDGMEYCLFMTTTLTERSVVAWKELVLPYNSSPRNSLKIIVRLLLRTSCQHDGVLIPVMSLHIQQRSANLWRLLVEESMSMHESTVQCVLLRHYCHNTIRLNLPFAKTFTFWVFINCAKCIHEFKV